MRTRDKWRKLARKTNNPLAWSGHKKFKREVRRELMMAEKEYCTLQARYKTILVTLAISGKLFVVVFHGNHLEGKFLLRTKKVVANEFNQFFNSVGEKTVDKIKSLAEEYNYEFTQHPFVPRSFPLEQEFSFKPVEQYEIEEIILSMPTGKAPGIYKIPLRVVKDCLPVVLPSLTSIINKSFTTETFTTVWKRVEVIPILKNGDHEEANNNRPISLLPILSKIC